MDIITYSSLFPNAVQPSHGIFVERRLHELIDRCDINATVVAPVPWFPFRTRLFGEYGNFAKIPNMEMRRGIEVLHPNYFVVPKISMLATPFSMARFTESSVHKVIMAHDKVPLLDAHYLYPDGVAAGLLAKKLKVPFILTARGSDVNVIAKLKIPRRLILATCNNAKAVIAVSNALADEIRALGVDNKKIHVIPNGVSLTKFRPGKTNEAKRVIGSKNLTFLSVGSLKEAKGHHLAIEAISKIDDAVLFIVGQGPFENRLRRVANEFGVATRVFFTGLIEPDRLSVYYQAADAVFLLSSREGMPNVILESLACGTPVIAPDVGGISEVLCADDCGKLIASPDADLAVHAWREIANRGVDKVKIRAVAEQLGWENSVKKLYSVMLQSVNQKAA